MGVRCINNNHNDNDMEQTVEKIIQGIDEAIEGFGNLDRVEIIRSVIGDLNVMADGFLVEEYGLETED